MIGQKFGKLTVISAEGKNSKTRSLLWRCLCECGKEKVTSGTSLRIGNTKSCGCLSIETCKQLGSHTKYTPEELVLNFTFTEYKKRAGKKHFSFTLTKEDFTKCIQSDCHYCGTSVEDTKNRFRYTRAGEVIQLGYNGIDRIDSNKGYDIGNVVPCCRVCNYAKNDLTSEEFLTWIKKIYSNMIKDKE
jgi:hypothetical protein